MDTTIFIAGSRAIHCLDEKVRERIARIVSSGFNVIIGDADGADKSVQQCLHDYHATNVTVYCSGVAPRNNVADWPVCRVDTKALAGSRAFFTAKDLVMARSSDYGLMIWDGQSPGTLSNVIELLGKGKKSLVFVSQDKVFVKITNQADLIGLLHGMTTPARSNAERKINLSARIAALDSFRVPEMNAERE